jgi:hypothetical protein
MASFDWPQFLARNRIEYVTSGPNTSRGRISVKCPWCGAADPSQHMTISLNGRGWMCWRNREHRGLQPPRLVAALLRCDLEQAKVIVYGEGSIQLPDDFLSRVNGVLAPKAVAHSTKLYLPREFLSFMDLPSARPFIRYLRGRGFDQGQIMGLTKNYGVRYCTQGAFASRIIFPIYFQGQLVNWTGRTISQRENLRYKTLATEPDPVRGVPAAVGPISSYLLWYDQLADRDCDTLALCEGPVDALKLNILGRQHGVAATCFFTSRPTRAQIDLLHELAPRFRRVVLLLDADMQGMAYRVAGELSSLGAQVLQLPQGVKDPGELRANQVEQLFLQAHADFA